MLGAPTALPLAAVAGCILGGAWWSAAGVAAVLALAARAWRVAAAVALCVLVTTLHLNLRERGAEQLRAAMQNGTAELCGTVTRTLRSGVLLQPQGWCPAVHLRGVRGVMPGDQVRARAALVPPEAPPVRGMFDREAWQRGQGIALCADAVSWEPAGRPLSAAAVRGLALRVRAQLERRLMPPGREADARRQVLCALVLGAKESADEETMAAFRRGGCLHMFAVSGLHVGIMAGVVWWLLLRVRVRLRVARPLMLLLVGVYVLVTGCAVSAVRAYLMVAVFQGGKMLRRRVSGFNTWCAVALGVLLVQPYALYDAAFLLSFGVYAAIVAGAMYALRHDSPWFGPDAYIPFRVLSKGELRCKAWEQQMRGVVVVSAVAYAVSLPLSMLCFHSVSPWAFFANVAVALPLLVSMVGGLVLLVCAGIPVLGVCAAYAADAAAGCLLATVGFFGALPGAYLPAARPQPADAVAVYELGYGRSCCVLGNPGVVVQPGNAYQAGRVSAPAVFHAGFSPAIVVADDRADSDALTALALYFPRLRAVSPQRPAVFTTAAGQYTIYPAPSDLPPTPAQNRLPVILWEHAGLRTLYVGDASAATVATVPPDQRRADVLILGAHPTLPFGEAEDIAAFGSPELRLLPSAEQYRAALRLRTAEPGEELGI